MEQPALQILNENRIMSIATVRPDGWPQSTIVGYANEGWRLYFLIYRTSQKFENISHDDRVSVSVGHEPRMLRDIKAVYAGCHAREVTDLKERGHAWMLLAERHPNADTCLCWITPRGWVTVRRSLSKRRPLPSREHAHRVPRP